MPDPRKKLYSTLSSKFDLGTFDEFNSKMDNPESRKKLYNSVSSNFDLGSYDEFESKIAPVKKKDSTSTSTTSGKSSASGQKVGSSGTQEFELKPVFDERGRQVKIKNEKGELVPYMEKVPKGFASSTEEREIVREEQKKKASKPIIPSANLTKYKEATKITDEEKSTLQQEVEDEFNQQGIWNGMKTGMKKGFNTLANVVTTIGTFGSETEAPIQLEVDPFAKEKKQAKEELVAEKKAVTPQAITERAKQIKLKNRLDGLKVDKNNEYLSNLPEEEVKALNLEKVREYKTLGDKEKYIATKSELLKNDFDKEVKDLTVARAILEKNKKEGVVPNENLINFAIEKQENVKNKLAEAEELEKEYLASKDNIGTAEEEIDFLKRNYDTTDKVTTLAKLGLGDLWNSVANKLPLMVSDLDQAIFEPLRPGSSEGILSEEERQELIDKSIDWETAKELAKSGVKRDVDFDNLNVDNFGQFFAQELGTQLPIFAQMAMPGGIVSIGMTSTFDKYGRMEQESNNISFEFDGKQFSGFEKENGEIVDSLGNTYDPNEVKITSLRTPDQSTANKFLTSVTFGTAEAVLGALPTKNIFGRALNSLQTSGERTLFRESIKQFAKAKGAGVLDATATEVVSEGATQVVQNIADIASGKKDVGVFDGVDHAAVSAGMLSFFMSASPAIAGIALKPFAQNKENKQVNDNLQQIFALQEQLNNTEISDVSRAAIQNKIEGLEKANGDILDGIASRTKGVSKEVFDAIKDVNKKQEILTIQATEIKNDPSLDVEVKKQLIADLESQFNQLEKKRATLVGGNATVLDALPDSESTRLRQNASETLVQEEKAKGKADSEINFTEEQINAKAIEIYNQSNQNAVQQEATITETKQEAQPQAEVQETEQEVLETPTTENITTEENNKIDLFLNFKGKDYKANYQGYSPKTKNAKISIQEGAGLSSYQIYAEDGSFIIGLIKGADFERDGGSENRGEVLNLKSETKGNGTSLMLDALYNMKKNGVNLVKFTQPSKEGKPFNDYLEQKGFIKKNKEDNKGNIEYEITDKVISEFESKINETTQTSDTSTNGNIRPTVGEVAEVGGTTEQTTEDVTTESIPQAVDNRGNKDSIKKEAKEDNVVVDGDDLILKHGTPHNFDQFQLEKIGTGEGAQAFGYGLYFTDGSKIAESYAKKLSEDKTGIVYTVRIKNGRTSNWADWREPLNQEQEEVLYNSLTKEERAIYQEHLDKAFYPDSPKYDMKYEKEYHGTFDDLRTDKDGFASYEKQSAAGLIYMDLKDAFGQEKATEILKRSGIDGIRYKARRGYGQETNYVVFNPESISIESKSIEQNKTTEPTTSKRETKRVVSKTARNPKTGEAAEFDVDIVDGQVVEIRKPRTGKVVPKFVEVKDKATKKVKRIQRNANWTAIADEALGQRTNNDIAKEDKATTDKAIQSFEPVNEYDYALQFFATGGNVNSQSAQRETGLSNKEVKWATGFKPDSELDSVERVAEKIVMDAEKSGVTGLDMQEVRNALIDIIKSYTRDSVKQEIVDAQKSRQEAKEKSEEDAYLNSLTKDEYNEYQRLKAETLIERADQEFLESMTEDEIRDYYQQKYNEQQQSEQQYYETEQQQGEQRNEEQIGSTEISSVQEIQGEPKSERLTDQINNLLDDLDKRLKDFGNETLGINIPVVIARGAIKAMKLANNGVATLEDVVQAGIDYIKSTDWYANLSDVNKTAIDKNTFMSVLDSTIKANDAAKKTIESLRQKIQDNKTNSKQIVTDIKNFLANNSIDGVLTPAQANALITKANEILTAKDTLKAFDIFVNYYNKVKDKAENKLNEKAKAKLRYEKQKQRVLDLKSQGKSLSQTISSLESEKGKPLSEKEKQMVELIFKTGDVANMSDSDVNDVVDSAFEKSRDIVKQSNNAWKKIKEKFKGLRAKFLDAQADAKRIIKSNQLGTVLDRLIALKGASAKAEMVFNEAKEKIYSGLKTEQRKVLDEIIMLRRILAIDENRAKKGLTPVLHPDFITGEIAKRKLEIIKDRIGDQAYSDLNNRADMYFDEFRNILNEMQKSGLISQKTRDELFDVDYQPRKFLHYLMNGDEEISENAKSWQKSTFSLSGDQIKALEEGSIEPLVLDSEWLLATAMSMRYKSIFMNALNSKLASEFNKKEVEIKALKAIPESQRTKAEKKKIAEFEKMKEVFIDNPIIGVTKSGNPKYKFDTTPAGYKIAYYYKNGVQNKFFIKENIYEQWYNEKKFINNPKLLENLSIISGSKLLKAMATGKNPFFLITNIPRDFMSVMLISPEYSKFKVLAIGQLLKDLGKSFIAIKNKNDMFEKYFEYGGGMSFLSTEGMLTGKSFITDLMESKSHNKIVATLLDAKVKENAVKWLNNITLNEINQYSELIFRISVFNRSIQNQLKELGVSDINDIEDIIDSEGNVIATKKEQQDDIYFRAVASARSIMDFNQGGYITKDMESVMPYLNAATQGSRVLFDAFAERPFETTSNILQLTTIGITSAIGASLAAIAMFSDEDEERSSIEIYLDNMSMVSPHDRRNNFIIFTGKKDEDGNPIYIKIAKAQQITPFTVISEHIVLNKLRRDYGMKEDGKLFEKSLDAINDNISPIQWLSFREDPTLIGVSLIARNPFGRAAMTYTTGYDFYRQEKLSWDIDKKGVPKYMEGYSSDRVDDFYKEIGMDLKMSPVRMKAMVESVLTSPSTNPYLGIMYGGLDAAITDKSFKEKSQVALENTLKNISKRITNTGKPYNKTLEEKEELKKKIEVIQAENIIFNAKIDDIAKDYINKKDSKEVFRNRLIKELKLEPFKADRAVNRIVDKIKFKDVDPFYIDLKYEQDNEVKALMLFNHLGDVKKLKMEDRKKIGEQLEKIGFKLNEEIANEYMKFVREYEER